MTPETDLDFHPERAEEEARREEEARFARRVRREVQKLRERSIRLEEQRYSITTHSAVVRELERRGIALSDPKAPAEIIDD